MKTTSQLKNKPHENFKITYFEKITNIDLTEHELKKNNQLKLLEYLTSRTSLQNLLIQKGIQKELHDLEIINHHYLKDFPNLLVSISHTKTIGAAFIYEKGDNAHSIGIDIELTSRELSSKIEKYFHNSHDHLEDELPFLKLWTQKEAIFKAISPIENNTITYQDIDCDGEHFSYKDLYHGEYVTIIENDLIVSLAILTSRTSL